MPTCYLAQCFSVNMKKSFGFVSGKFCGYSYTGISFPAKNLFTKRACGRCIAMMQ